MEETVSTPLPSCGLHANVPFDQYCEWDAVNIHSLMPMDDSPMHCAWDRSHPKSSPEMDVGSACHVAVFEPARLEKEFFFGREEFDGRTKEGKAAIAAEQEEAAGRKYIRKKRGDSVDCDSVTGMAAALWNFGPAKKFLEMPGQCEISALWTDPENGLLCKGRFDKLIPKEVSPFKRDVIVELKTTGKGHAKTFAFGRECDKWNYAEQAAFYSRGLKILHGESPLHVFLVVENVGPYAPNWGTLDDASMQTGDLNASAWLREYAACVKTGKWPGYPELENGNCPQFGLPPWRNKQTINSFE